MWIFINSLNKNKYPLLISQEYSIGRKNCNIIILDDASISRKHAILYIKKDITDGSAIFTLQDFSKYGTFINGQPINKNNIDGNQIRIYLEDIITFGIQNCKFHFHSENDCFTTSLINDVQEKSEIVDLASKLNYNMYDNWWQYEKNLDHTHIQNCDFLLMNTLNMTPKVLSALMCGKPIVNSNYLKRILKICQDFISTTDENEKFDFKKPNTEDYMPEITDSSLLKPEYNFGPDPSRVSLFSNKIFIFCDKLQFCKYDPIIRSGSGECQYVDSLSQYQRNITLKATHQQLLLIMMTSDNIQEWVNEIYQDWQIQGKRLIPESEICCAILENSLINYCNSDANTNANLTGPIEPALATSIKNIESDNDNNRNSRASEKTKLDPTIKRIRSQLTSSTNDCSNEKLKTNIQADSVEMDEFDWFNVRKMSSNIQSAIGDDDKVAAQISTGLITNESSEANTITNDAKRFAVDDDGWLYTDPSLKSNKTLNIGSSKNVEIVTRKNDRDNLEADTHLKKVVVTRYKKSFDPDPLFCILGREVICDTKVVQTHRHDYNNKDSGNEITGVIIEKESNVASNLKDVTKNINGNGVLTTKKRLNDVEDEDIKVTRIQQKSQSHVKIPKREDPMKFFDFSIKRRINQDSKKLKPS